MCLDSLDSRVCWLQDLVRRAAVSELCLSSQHAVQAERERGGTGGDKVGERGSGAHAGPEERRVRDPERLRGGDDQGQRSSAEQQRR